jgi:hypothetical protein
MSTPSTRRLTALLIFVLSFSPACNVLGGLPSASPSGELTLDQEITFGPGSLIYADTRAGLSALASYTVSLTFEFDGSRDGQPEQWRQTYLMLASNEPRARQWTIESTGSAAQSGTTFLAALGGLDYEVSGGEGCTANESLPGDSFSDRFELASFLTGVIGAEEGGTDRVNDIASARYTFDERALGESGLAKSTGEMWVASDGGYIVRYLLTTAGDADYFGEGIQGTLFTAYELTGPNQAVLIELPEDCPPGMVDAPLLPDATNIARAPGSLVYDTPTRLTDASAFYQEQIPGLGWVLDGEPTISETTAVFNYRQGDQILTVLLSAQADITTVNIMTGRSGS